MSCAARTCSAACRSSGRCSLAAVSDGSTAGTVVGAEGRVGEDDVARFVRADGVEQRQRRVLPVVLRDEQRLARARELHICLCNVETRAGAGFELILRRLEQAREERDVGLTRVDLRLRALCEQIQPRDRRSDVVLRLLALIVTRFGRAFQRLVAPQRREVEDLHGRGELPIGDVERTDDRRQSGQRKAERGEVDRLAVLHQLRVRLRQQRAQRFTTRNPRHLLVRSRQLRLRPVAEGHADGVVEREAERLRRRLRGSAERDCKKKEGESFRKHGFKAPLLGCNPVASTE